MADLKELYEKFRNTSNSSGAALGRAITSPLQTLGGATWGAASGIGSFIGTVGADIKQAAFGDNSTFLGNKPSQRIIPNQIDPDTHEIVPEWNQRVRAGANALSLGLRPMFWQNYDKTRSYDSALGNTLYDASPLPEIKALITGGSKLTPGQPISPYEYGENITTGILKSLPFIRAGKKLGLSNLKDGVIEGPEFHKAVSTVDKLVDSDTLLAAKRAEVLPKMAELRSKIADAEKANLPDIQLGLMKELQGMTDSITNVPPGFISEVYGQLDKTHPGIWQNQFAKALREMEETGKPLKRITEQIADTIETMPGIADTIKDIGLAHGFTPEAVAGLYPAVAHAVRSAAKTSGQTLQDISKIARQADRYYDEILKTNPELVEQLNQLRGKTILGDGPIPAWTKFTNRFNAYSDVVRGALTSGIPTFSRNATAGGLGFASKLFDDMMVGTWQYAIGKGLKGLGKIDESITLKDAYWNVANDLLTMQQHAMGGVRSVHDWFTDQAGGKTVGKGLLHGLEPLIDETNKLYPTVIQKMLGAPVDELVHVNLMSEGLQGAVKNIKRAAGNVETAGDGARLGLSILSTPNIMQEMFWRKFYFSTRLRENSRRFGYETPEIMYEQLRKDEGPTKRWFGEEVTADKIAEMRKSGKLADSLNENISEYRLKNADAVNGRDLHSTQTKRINKLSESEKVAANKEITKIEERLRAGEKWSEIGPDVSEPVKRTFGGDIQDTSMAVTDAAEYALKQTFAMTPTRGTLGYGILKMFQDMPLLYAMGTPFPRFMLNATNWVLEHDPSTIHNIVKPSFAKELVNITKDPTKITDVRLMERFGQAQTGGALWAAAHAMRAANMMGPKYYQLKAGKDSEGNDRLVDMRPYNPFVQFAFIDHLMTALGNGQEPNLTASEFTEALFGLRRLNEVGVFAITDIVRQIDSSNPGAFINSLKPIAGQYMAGILTPFRIPIDVAAAFGSQSAAEQKDLSGNELLGPSMNNLPFVRNSLPARPDPFTGQPGVSQYPAIRLLGPNVKSMSVLEQQIAHTGTPLNDLLGNYADPEADRIVRKNIGDVLSRKTADGRSMGQVIGEEIAHMTADKPIELKRDMLRMVFASLRDGAYKQGLAQNPRAFMEHIIRQQPETMRPILRNRLEEMFK